VILKFEPLEINQIWLFFEPIKESYQINQNIRVEGAAKSFSGANIWFKVKYKISYMVYVL
jgi:hypothetical protein